MDPSRPPPGFMKNLKVMFDVRDVSIGRRCMQRLGWGAPVGRLAGWLQGGSQLAHGLLRLPCMQVVTDVNETVQQTVQQTTDNLTGVHGCA